MANLKFSQFTEQTDTSNVQFIVGYNGATNVRISPANISGAYLPLAGGTLTGNVLFTDNTQLQLGTGNDMQIYHDPSGSGTNIFNSTLGSLKFIQNQNDGLIEFENDNGSGGIESYFILNGSDETIRAYKTLKSGTTNLALEANNAGFVEIRSANGTTPGTLQLNCEQNSHGIKIQGPPHSAGANYTLVFPTTDGGTGEFLQTNGSGVLTWAAAGTGTVTSVTTGNANTITIGGTSAAPTVAANTAAVTNGSLNLATGDQIYDFVIAQGYTTNIGTVTSVGLAMPAAFSVANSPVTTSGTLTVTGAGTTSQYVRGDGTLNTFPTIPTVPANIVETVTTTDGTFINLTPNTATDGAVTVTADLSATGTPSSSTYLRGDNTWAAISGGFTSFDITGGSGSAQTITNGNTVTLAQGTGISTVAGATDTVTITNTLPFNSLTLAGDSGASQSITNNNTITLAGGTGLSSVASATDTVTFNANVDGVQSIAAETSTTTADRTYKVQVDSSDNLVVNVPWIAGSSGIGGSIASQQIAFGTGTNTIGGESDLIYNSSNNTLSVGSGTGSGSIYTTGNVTAEANFILGAYVYHNGDTNTFFGFPANDTFTINTNGLERLRIASAGQIGIGGTNYGTSGNVLTSNGPSAAPSWQAAGGSSYSWTIQGDSGSEAVASGDTIDFAGGTNITTSYDTTSNTLTINSSAGGATDLNGLSDCKTTSGGSVYVGNALPFATGSGNTYLSSSTSYLRAGTNNTAVGVFSGVQTQIWPDTLYTGNTTIGYGAAQQATTGCDHIVAIGESAGKWADGTGSVCIGTDSGSGASAVSSNGYNGDASIAIGYKANALSGMASNRIVIGAYAGYNMYRTAGATDPNLAIGYRAMYGDSLYNNSSYNNGEGNTVIGSYAMEHTTGNGTTADFSTIIGYKAGQTTFTGNGNVLIGVLAEPSTTATGNQCTIRVGTDSSFGAYTARFSSGISSWTFASDVRLKENIEDLDLGLDFINKLKPRKFKWKDSDKNSAGFIAQEVLDIEKEHNSENYSNIINVTNPDKLEIAPSAIIPMLVNSIKELTAEVKELKKELENLKNK